jgi:hypothetical protein
MATKGKRSVGYLSSMFSVDKVLLGECSMLNTELVIAKIQIQIFHIPALELLNGHVVHAKKQ